MRKRPMHRRSTRFAAVRWGTVGCGQCLMRRPTLCDKSAKMKVFAQRGQTERVPRFEGAASRMSVSGPEAASNRLCHALMLAGTSDPRLADYYSNTDSIVALSEEVAEYTLWRREGDVLVQALPAPPSSVCDWVERIALQEPEGVVAEAQFETTADFLDMWEAATLLPRPKSTSRDWVAATIHPRMPVIRVCAGPDWVYRWQVAALTGLALSEGGWNGTTKRAALLSLLTGAVDWPKSAAIRVAAEVALREPEATAELRRILIELTYSIDREENGGITCTLCDALEMIPYVPREYLDRLRSRIAGEEGSPKVGSEGENSKAEGPATAAPTRKWWKFWGSS